MAILEYAIELGSSYTTIYEKGKGMVLREPTVIAVDAKSNEVKAVGNEAKKLVGKNSDNLSIVFPIKESQIANSDLTVELLNHFIRKITPKRVVVPRIKFYLLVPIATTQKELDEFKVVCYKAGVGEVIPIWNTLATAVGAGLPLTSADCSLIIDIGGGSTNVSAVNLNGIIEGISVNASGYKLDTALIDYLATEKGIKVGYNTIEKIKEEIGSLYLNDSSSTTINGKDTESGLPKTIAIGAKDLYPTIKRSYLIIVDAVKAILQLLKDEITIDVLEKGIFVVGGGALISGLAEFFGKELRIRTCIIDNPEFTTITGAGKLIENEKLLVEILTAMDV